MAKRSSTKKDETPKAEAPVKASVKRPKRHRNQTGAAQKISAEAFLKRTKSPARLATSLRARADGDRTFSEWRMLFASMMNEPTEG